MKRKELESSETVINGDYILQDPNIIIEGDLRVNGNIQGYDLTVKGNLYCEGNFKLHKLLVEGDLYYNGEPFTCYIFEVKGNVKIIKA